MIQCFGLVQFAIYICTSGGGSRVRLGFYNFVSIVLSYHRVLLYFIRINLTSLLGLFPITDKKPKILIQTEIKLRRNK